MRGVFGVGNFVGFDFVRCLSGLGDGGIAGESFSSGFFKDGNLRRWYFCSVTLRFGLQWFSFFCFLKNTSPPQSEAPIEID